MTLNMIFNLIIMFGFKNHFLTKFIKKKNTIKIIGTV